MNSIFGMDSPLIRGLTKFADLVILNIVFLITCIPIFTIGTGITSMYEITLKMVKNQEPYIFKGYLDAFKSNFKKCTKIWLIVLALFIIFIVDLYIISANDGDLWRMLQIVIFGFTMFLWILIAYVFPLMAKFENTIKNTIVNAWYMVVKHFPTTITVVFFNTLFLICMMYNAYTLVYGILAYLIIGFALIAYVNSIFLVKVFEKYYEKNEVE
ncbi:MAG: DUF624 domain-containing protein [Eubacteriales bacterium]